MIEHLRAVRRMVLMFAYSAPHLVLQLAVQILLPLSPERAGRIRSALINLWARGMARIIGMEVLSEGKVPTDRGLLVTNHLSYVDIVVLWALVPGVFISKSEVSRWPFIGLFGKSTGTLFLDRNHAADLKRVVPLMCQAIEQGHHVILFAEGTTSPGAEVLPFMPSLFEAAVRTSTPVTCATIFYEVEPDAVPAHQSVCWWGDMTFYDHLYNLFRMRSFRAKVQVLEKTHLSKSSKDLAEETRNAISANFRPMVVADPTAD